MIDRIDHLVLTTTHPEACIDFYVRVMGMTLERFRGGTPGGTNGLPIRTAENQPACEGR